MRQAATSLGPDYGGILIVVAMLAGSGLGLACVLSAAGVQSIGVLGAVGTQVGRAAIGGMGRIGAAGHVLLGVAGLAGTIAALVFGYLVGAAAA